MKIEIGKFYKTRDGRKAVAKEDDGTDVYPVIVVIADTAYYHNRDGSYLNDGLSDFDLVAEWATPAPVAGLKIGDRVRLKSAKQWGSLGIGTIVTPDHGGDKVGVIYPGGTFKWHFDADELDLVAEVPSPAPTAAYPHIVAVTINGKPSPASKPVVHSNREAAVTEAKRLAALNPGSEFAVYRRVSAVTAELVMREAA